MLEYNFEFKVKMIEIIVMVIKVFLLKVIRLLFYEIMVGFVYD